MTPHSTLQGISALLKRAGFNRSVSSATRVKGWRNSSEGFKVSGIDPGVVNVEHKTGYERGPRAAGLRDEALDEYATVLIAAGYSVRRDETWAFARLIVTAGKADQ